MIALALSLGVPGKPCQLLTQYLAYTKFYSIVYDVLAIDPHTIFIILSDILFADNSATRFSS